MAESSKVSVHDEGVTIEPIDQRYAPAQCEPNVDVNDHGSDGDNDAPISMQNTIEELNKYHRRVWLLLFNNPCT